MASSGTRSRATGLRIVVLGYIVRGPLGGLAWHHLQYVLGLVRLGHDVCFIEDSGDVPACYDPGRDVTGDDPGYGLHFAAQAFGRLGLGGCWGYHDALRRRWLGPLAARAARLAASAEVVINLSGVNPLRPWLERPPVRVLVDTDPVFTQIRHLRDPAAMAEARKHTAFMTFGVNLAAELATRRQAGSRRGGDGGGDGDGKGGGSPGVPDDGLPWRPTRQPVVCDAWPVTPGPPRGRFTTVMQWESYPPVEYGGRRFGMKGEGFGEFLDLPRHAREQLELAVGSPTAPRERLRARGWEVIDPRIPTRDPWTYQRYIQGSRGELAIAKHGYVTSRCGWFSERSTAYMACGRPVVVQDTGFGQWLPAGSGVLAFRSADEALAALDNVCTRYREHCRAARALVETHFDAAMVLDRLLADAHRPAPADGTASADARGADPAIQQEE